MEALAFRSDHPGARILICLQECPERIVAGLRVKRAENAVELPVVPPVSVPEGFIVPAELE
jgi:hypothetical protein